jgi:hypothetical protein
MARNVRERFESQAKMIANQAKFNTRFSGVIKKGDNVTWNTSFGTFTGKVKTIISNPNGFTVYRVVPEGRDPSQAIDVSESGIISTESKN